MFTEKKVKELSDFVGIDFNPSMIKKKVNSSEKVSELDDDVIKEVQTFYKDVYEYCHLNYPQTKELWRQIT